jgi:hypothetical protein
MFTHRHEKVSYRVAEILNRFADLGEANPLHGHHLSRGLRSALLVEDHTQTGKDPPGLFQPEDTQNKKSIVHHGPREPAAGDRKLKLCTLPW